MKQPWIYTCSPSWNTLPPPSPSHPSGSSQCTIPEHLSHASYLDWRSVSHLVIYMFRCCSLRSPHPRLLPLFSLSEHQGLFKWVNSSHEVAKVFGVSATISVLPMNTQDWSPLGWAGWISLLPKGLLRVFSNTTVQKHQFFGAQLSWWSNSHIHTWPLAKNIALTRWTFVGKVMSLPFNMLSRLVITFLLRSKRLLISWLHPPSAVILEPRKIKSATVCTVSPSICHEVMGPDAMILSFLNVEL